MRFENKSVLIVTPAYQGLPYNDFTVSLFRLYEYSKYTQKNDIEWSIVSDPNIYALRNKAMKDFLASRFHSLLMIDNDMVFHHTILERLFERDKDIIMPLFTNKIAGLPEMNNAIIPLACVEDRAKGLRRLSHEEIDNLTGPVKVAANGFGMVLIKRRVLEGMEFPYCQGVVMPKGEITERGVMGVDYYFCLKASEAGFEVWLDPTEIAMHLGMKVYGIWDVAYPPQPKADTNLRIFKKPLLVPA